MLNAATAKYVRNRLERVIQAKAIGLPGHHVCDAFDLLKESEIVLSNLMKEVDDTHGTA